MAGLPIEVILDEHTIGVPVPEDPPIDRKIAKPALLQALGTIPLLPPNVANDLADAIANPPLPAPFNLLPNQAQQAIRDFLRPSLSMKFYSTGNCNDPSGVRIEKVFGYLEGILQGSIRPFNIGVTFELSAQPMAGGGYIIDDCPTNQGGPIKKIIKRNFHTVLMAKLTIQPGGQLSLGLLDLVQPVIVNCCEPLPVRKRKRPVKKRMR